ncbi:unnamed protein product [Parnassius apollo]|uniref:(apollo) hypothetical protein n=1 Tax=Parnassius apollo TaxID=110799 RepID=A0A8S3XK46_PARAO|nr:unnamed protein product [Parnassius apollo]
MEVDSVHSTLEKKFKAPIFTPMDYVSRMRQCRPSQPYVVHYLDLNFSKNYEEVPGNFTTIRPGRRFGDATVNDIRGILYVNGEVQYKVRHSYEWEALPQRTINSREPVAPARLYNSPINNDVTK